MSDAPKPDQKRALVAAAALCLPTIAACTLLYLLRPQPAAPWIAPEFALPGLWLYVTMCIALLAMGVAVFLLSKKATAWPRELLPSLIAICLLCILFQSSIQYARLPPLAFASASAALISSAIATRCARTIRLACGLLLVPMLLYCTYASALFYAISMLNP